LKEKTRFSLSFNAKLDQIMNVLGPIHLHSFCRGVPSVTKTCPTLFVTHGGGPCFWMNLDPPHLFHALRKFIDDLPNRFSERTSAIVVVLAHWEEPDFTIQSTLNPAMIHDYVGFRSETDRLSYPAFGFDRRIF